MERFDLVVVGSGPAGYTAGIYAARAERKTAIVTGISLGGQLTETSFVENYPGFPQKILGQELMAAMRKQAENLGAKLFLGKVKGIEKDGEGFKLVLEEGERLLTRAVIIAVGAAARWLQVPGEEEFKGKGVSGCAVCDGAFFRDRIVAVVGGGDSAVEDASYAAKFAKKVYLIHRRDELRAGAAEQKRVKENPKIEILWNSQVKEIKGKERVESVVLDILGKEKELALDGVFVAIGRIPATNFLRGFLELGEAGHIVTGGGKFLTMSSVEGVFAAGDCVDRIFRQAVVAAGEGCKAAMEVEKWLDEKEDRSA